MTIRYRKQTATGDYVFGEPPSVQEFYIDEQAAIAQAIRTRLQLVTGDWFLDLDEGTPYNTEILGFVPPNVRDFAIRQRILDTIGVNTITSYTSTLDQDRRCVVTSFVDTIYGEVALNITI